jgi:hypothetical protein
MIENAWRENPPAWPIYFPIQSNDHLYSNPSILSQQKRTRSQYIQSMREPRRLIKPAPMYLVGIIVANPTTSPSDEQTLPIQRRLFVHQTAFKLGARSALYDDGFPPTVARDSETTSGQASKICPDEKRIVSDSYRKAG